MITRIIGSLVLILVLGGLYFYMEEDSSIPNPKQPIAPLNSSDSDFKNLKIN